MLALPAAAFPESSDTVTWSTLLRPLASPLAAASRTAWAMLRR